MKTPEQIAAKYNQLEEALVKEVNCNQASMLIQNIKVVARIKRIAQTVTDLNAELSHLSAKLKLSRLSDEEREYIKNDIAFLCWALDKPFPKDEY